MDVPAWIMDEVTAFGSALGLDTLTLDAAGRAGLAFENGQRLRLEYHPGMLVIYSVTSPDSPVEPLVLAAQCRPGTPRRRSHMPLQMALHHGQVVRLVRLEESTISRGTIDEAFRKVMGL